MTSSRTGIGIDVHRLKKGGPIILGGVQIPHEYGLLGHSDGDVLLHAVIDGFLGAANIGDIGVHFPSDNPDYKGRSKTTGTGGRELWRLMNYPKNWKN